MTETEALAHVLELACLTEDRTGPEQRALLDTALRLDLERGRFVRYQRGVPPRFVEMARASYVPADGRRVDLTAGQRKKLERLEAKFVRCGCGVLQGGHPLECANGER